MKNEYYSTPDLALATCLSLFYPVDSIDKRIPTKFIFNFQQKEGFEKVLEQYWRRELKIEPQAYFAQIKFIKSYIYEKKYE